MIVRVAVPGLVSMVVVMAVLVVMRVTARVLLFGIVVHTALRRLDGNAGVPR
jgi:hypothetical protein